MEPAWLKSKLRSKPISSYHKVPQLRFTPGTGCESGEPTTTERRMVWFGKGRLETQVKLCADRLLHLVILHPDQPVIEQIQQTVADWLAQIGLELKPSKTRITQTFHSHQGAIGFDFLGFHIRQYPVGKTHSAKSTGRHPKLLGFKTIIKPSQTALKRHQQALRAVIKRHRSISQARLIGQLNPIIKGWTAYYSTVCSKATFGKMAYLTFLKLKRWAYRRHPGKSRTWVIHKYWRLDQNCWDFAPPEGKRLYYHNKTPIQRYVKVQGSKSPYDAYRYT